MTVKKLMLSTQQVLFVILSNALLVYTFKLDEIS